MNLTNTRRTLLKVAAALGGSTVVGASLGAAQDESDDTGDADFQLGGEQSGWEGISPDEIEGETNPALELAADEEYVLEWENLDGIGHNFVIEDGDGEDLVETEIITSGTQTVEFTASEEMEEYYCQPHPTSMRGDVEVGEGGNDDGDEADENPEEFAAPVDELHELTLDGDGWHLQESGDDATETDDEDGTDSEEETDGEGDEEEETNPTLELEEGNVYVLRVENELEPEDVADDEGDDDQGGDEDGDDDALEGDVQQQPAELVVLGEDDEEVVRSDVAESSGSAAVVFVATDGLAAYRDDETGAEGEIEVQESDEGGSDGEAGDGGTDEGDDEDA